MYELDTYVFPAIILKEKFLVFAGKHHEREISNCFLLKNGRHFIRPQYAIILGLT